MIRSAITLFLFVMMSHAAHARGVFLGTPDHITNWIISCSVDAGSIRGGGNTWVFTTSTNRCKGGVYKQRAEINTKGSLSTKKKAQYRFQSYFRMESHDVEKFDIFQIHDGRNGCAPPLKVNIQPSGRIKLRADYKTGPGEQCVRNVMKSSGLGKTPIKRDGREYKLDVLLDFDGEGGFHVAVYLDDRFQVSGRYDPPKEKGYFKSRYFYFKHGVYSYRLFDYQLTSTMSMRLIDSLNGDERAFEKNRLQKSKDNLIQSKELIIVPDNLESLLENNDELISCLRDEAIAVGMSEQSLSEYVNNAKDGKKIAIYRIAAMIRNGFCAIQK